MVHGPTSVPKRALAAVAAHGPAATNLLIYMCLIIIVCCYGYLYLETHPTLSVHAGASWHGQQGRTVRLREYKSLSEYRLHRSLVAGDSDAKWRFLMPKESKALSAEQMLLAPGFKGHAVKPNELLTTIMAPLDKDSTDGGSGGSSSSSGDDGDAAAEPTLSSSAS